MSAQGRKFKIPSCHADGDTYPLHVVFKFATQKNAFSVAPEGCAPVPRFRPSIFSNPFAGKRPLRRHPNEGRKSKCIAFMRRSGLFAGALLIFGGQSLAGDVDKKEAHLSASRLPHRPIPLILDMVHHNPGDKRYDSQFNDPAFIKKMGFNGKVYFLFDSPMLAVDWQSVDKSLMPEGSPARKWVDAAAKRIDGQIAACKKSGLKIYAMSDLILFPKALVKKYNMQNSFGDPRNPQTRKYLRLLIDQVFKRFPDYDGLVVRIGETYLNDAPHHTGKIVNKKSPDKCIIPLMKLLREEVCVKRGKTLIFRSWMSFDVSKANYLAVCEGVEPHPNLYMAVKFCEGDFHRANPFSKVLGTGRHKQVVEVQCAREYEGKGAYPNYVMNGVIEGFEEYRFLLPKDRIRSVREVYDTGLLAGVWTWSRGGGWSGPYIKDELWCDLNAWVAAQWAKNPEASEESVFKRYALERLGLNPSDYAAFRKMCLLSAEAVVRGRNSVHGDMNPWWTRDAGIGWPAFRKNADLKRNLRDKDESVAKWEEIVKLARQINWPSAKLKREAVSSSLYGLHLYRIYRAVVYLDYANRNGDADGIRRWLKEYDNAWADYDALPGKYPEVLATLYGKDFKWHINKPADREVEKIRKEYIDNK
jgi:hypothetical protein